LLEKRVTDLAAERLWVDLDSVDLLAIGIVDREFDHASPLADVVRTLRLILCVPVDWWHGVGIDLVNYKEFFVAADWFPY
jgi:hypothetical protein